MKTLEIFHKETIPLGRCYVAENYFVQSTVLLSKEKLQTLFEMGFFGAGQEFKVFNISYNGTVHVAEVQRRTDSGD